MFTSWTLENFKSVGPRLSLSLAPITVLVGANSSGKSTIIQSVLLLKQTLQYAQASRPIALNGPLLKLGNYRDVKNVSSDRLGFSIGWRFDPRAVLRMLPELSGRPDPLFARYSPLRLTVSDVACEARFVCDDNADELALLQPALSSCQVMARATDPEGAEQTADIQISRRARSQQAGRTTDPDRAPEDTYPYTIEQLDPETRSDILEDHPEGNIFGAFARHFLPNHAVVAFDSAKRSAAHIAEHICSLRSTTRYRMDYQNLHVPPSVLALMEDWLRANSAFFREQPGLFDTSSLRHVAVVSDLFDALRSLRQRFVRASKAASFPSLEDLKPRIAEEFEKSLESRIQVELMRPRIISDATSRMASYFENYVRYLGPLRDEPKPLYPLEALADPSDVGYRGEHTAAVLDLNQFEEVGYIPSASFTADRIQAVHRTDGLRRAVNDWMSYMGVIESVSTEDRGKIGHELQVKLDGVNKYHDLTNVGVGVSQVLPIVVMALLSSPGSLLIFEQPELHLHPRVQTRLADFFVAIALSGKQCILETHSEYLIHRLRRRIAEAPSDRLVPTTKLYFVERQSGATSCRQVDISKYGAIVDWPADFFDQSQQEVERIITAAAVKRADEKPQR